MIGHRRFAALGCHAALSLLGVGLACQDERSAPRLSAGPSAAPQAPPRASPLAAAPFAYSPVGKRDPFRSSLLEAPAAERVPQGRPHLATERFELDQYQLTAVVTGPTQPKAMVEDPSGHGHVLGIGSRLGRNGGRVARIAGHEVVIVERAADAAGKPLRVCIVKRLPRTGGPALAED